MKNLFKKVLTAAALCLTVLAVSGAVKAQAATLEYDAATDSIKGSGVAYIVKNADTVKIKASAEPIALSTTAQSLKELGCKEGNAVYFYIADAALTEDAEVKANKTILATKAKKVTGVIDYTAADNDASTNGLSATVIDPDKKTVTGLKLYWSEDGEAFKLNENTTALTGAYLKSKLEAGATIYIKVVDSTNATRTSKAVKVKIAKQAKAPSVKLDVKKSTIALKNGFDFVLATKTGENYAIAQKESKDLPWNTVLPVLKDSSNADAIVTGYTPLDKKADGAKASTTAFTKTKVKALSLADFVTELGNGASLADGFSFGVRKSATTKKPASAVAFYDVKAQTPAPQIYTEQNTSSYDIIAQGADVKFKTPTIVNAAWKVVENAVSYTGVWTGIGEDVKLSTESSIKKDEAAAKYEMAVIATADLANVDWTTVSWKAIKAGTNISEKTSTKYCVKGSTTKKSAAFSKANAATTVNTDGSNDAKVVLLIRRAGVKAKTISDSTIASEYMVTFLLKATGADGKPVYQWKTNGAKVGADAYTYEITVKTWQKATSGYAWTADKTKTIIGYCSTESDATYTFEDPDGFAYDLASVSGATAEGKKITIAKGAKDANKEVSINLQEKATIKIKFAGLATADKKDDAEVEMILGVAKEITSNVAAPTGYAISSVKIGDNPITPADNKYTATVNTAKDEITVTYEKAQG